MDCAQFIHMKIRWRDEDPWFLAVVYGSPQKMHHRGLWEGIRNISQNIQGPWCLMGDFNALLHNFERSGSNSQTMDARCRDFSQCVSDCGLINIGFKGWPFTWKRGNLVERLDKALVNIE